MTALADPDALEARVEMLEEALAGATAHAAVLDERVCSLEALDPPRRVAPAPGRLLPPRTARPQAATPFAPMEPSATAPEPTASLGDLVGGRVLAWLGGVATLLGIVLFLALAVSQGWIGVEARIVLAATASIALLAGGSRLHQHRGRTEAATAMVGAATAGLFATLVVASSVYGLCSGLLALAGSMVVGATAARLAIRWAGQPIGVLGFVGALISGALLGAPAGFATLAMVALMFAAAIVVAVNRRWRAVALAALLSAVPQWAGWALSGQGTGLELLVLCSFSAIGLVGAAGLALGSENGRARTLTGAFALANAGSLALVGWLVLSEAAGVGAGEAWLAALAMLHLLIGLGRLRGRSLPVPPSALMAAIGVALADVAFGLTAQGVGLTAGWGIAAVAFAALARRTVVTQLGRTGGTEAEGDPEAGLWRLGVGAQLALASIRAFVEAPPSALVDGAAGPAGLLGVALLAASLLTCGALLPQQGARWRATLQGLGLLAVGYLTALSLEGTPLVVAWALESGTLARSRRIDGDLPPRLASLAFLAGAGVLALASEAPPTALAGGNVDLWSAAVAIGALVLAMIRLALGEPREGAWREWLLIAAGLAGLYLASIAAASTLTAGAASSSSGLLELSVAQQGQVALSALWSVAGLCALVVGLRANIARLRATALLLLLATVAKVFLYDLSTLTSLYRVASFIVLGLLLLAGAYAYQRLRPPSTNGVR